MRVFDCFTFYNEFDLLEIRLQELWDVVDVFVIAEANTTHSGMPKPYYLTDNMDRFKPWADKIRIIQVADMPGVKDEPRISPDTNQFEVFKNCWYNERHQRNCLIRGLSDVQDDDIVLLGDLDEIVRPSCVEFIRNDKQHNMWAFRMPLFNYKFNYMWVDPLIYQVQTQAMTGTRMRTFRDFTHTKEFYGTTWYNRPMEYDDGVEMCLQHAGWHWSSLGDSAHVANKLRSFAHSEIAHQAETIDVDALIAEGKTSLKPQFKFEPVNLDSYFPKTILDNKEKYKDLILPDPGISILEKLAVNNIPFKE